MFSQTKHENYKSPQTYPPAALWSPSLCSDFMRIFRPSGPILGFPSGPRTYFFLCLCSYTVNTWLLHALG